MPWRSSTLYEQVLFDSTVIRRIMYQLSIHLQDRPGYVEAIRVTYYAFPEEEDVHDLEEPALFPEESASAAIFSEVSEAEVTTTSPSSNRSSSSESSHATILPGTYWQLPTPPSDTESIH